MLTPTVFFVTIVTLPYFCVFVDVPTEARYGIGDGGANWTISSDDSIPGIDAASVSRITLFAGPPQGLQFIVWSDLPNGRSGEGSGGMRDGASYKGQHRATDGRRMEFKAESRDGKNGTVEIAGVTYDLKKGSLFLVSTQQKPTIVKQVSFDAEKLPQRRQQLLRFAASNDLIGAFFAKHK